MGTNFGTPWMEREGTSNVTMEFEDGRLGYQLWHLGRARARGCGTQSTRIAQKGCSMPISQVANSCTSCAVKEKVLFETEPGKHTENEMAHFLDLH